MTSFQPLKSDQNLDQKSTAGDRLGVKKGMGAHGQNMGDKKEKNTRVRGGKKLTESRSRVVFGGRREGSFKEEQDKTRCIGQSRI